MNNQVMNQSFSFNPICFSSPSLIDDGGPQSQSPMQFPLRSHLREFCPYFFTYTTHHVSLVPTAMPVCPNSEIRVQELTSWLFWSILSPTASLAALARVPVDALLSLATDLLASEEAWLVAPWMVSEAEFAAFLGKGRGWVRGGLRGEGGRE